MANTIVKLVVGIVLVIVLLRVLDQILNPALLVPLALAGILFYVFTHIKPAPRRRRRR